MAGLGSIGLALALEIAGKKEKANFVGHWAPKFLILGVYNKLVKLHGSDGNVRIPRASLVFALDDMEFID